MNISKIFTRIAKILRILGTALRTLTPTIYSSATAWLGPENDGKKVVDEWKRFTKSRIEQPVYKELSLYETMKPYKCSDREWLCRHKSYSCLAPCPEYWLPEERNWQNPQILMNYVINFIHKNNIRYGF